MTLMEIDTLKQKDPERYYEFYLWILTKKKAESRKLQEYRDRKGDSGGKDIGYIKE